MSIRTGIEYKVTGESSRGQVADYHRKPSPLLLSKTPFKVDVAGLKKIQQRDAITFDGAAYGSKFTIGFEIEKNQLSRAAVKEYELFCGFERDGSCGYEAVTHILPLLPAGQWRNKVFDLFVKAEKIIDDRYSPSDRRCGGHITIAAEGFTGDALRAKIRENCGIFLALFRKRLSNTYCNHNVRLEGQFETSLHYNGWHSKYQLALVKGNCLEFRIPSKVESVKQLIRRYELFYEVVNHSINGNGKHETLLKTIKPIILSMYNNDEAKTNEVLGFARQFREFILNRNTTTGIAEFLNR